MLADTPFSICLKNVSVQEERLPKNNVVFLEAGSPIVIFILTVYGAQALCGIP